MVICQYLGYALLACVVLYFVIRFLLENTQSDDNLANELARTVEIEDEIIAKYDPL